MKTVVFLFHPDYQTSRVNRALVAGLSPDIAVRNLYQLYPDFQIDVATEQQMMKTADRVVFQFPLFWYGAPALLQQWEAQVLTYGWAYGSQGTALHGKELLIAVSPGADNYGRSGFVKYTVHELLRPFQATSRLIGMKYVTPFVTQGAASLSDPALQEQVVKYNTYLHRATLPVLGDFA